MECFCKCHELVRQCAIDIKLDPEVFTLEGMIEAYKNLRNLNLTLSKTRTKAIEEGRELGRKQVGSEYISIEKLEKMTIKELTELI